MYYYSLVIGIAKAKTEPALSRLFSEHDEAVRKAAEAFNRKAKANPKKLKDLHCDAQGRLCAKLSSELALTSLGKAIRGFSQLLLQNEAFKKAVTPGGQLLEIVDSRPIDVSDWGGAEESVGFSDLELLQALTAYVVLPKDADSSAYRMKKKAMEDIKEIACSVGILKREQPASAAETDGAYPPIGG